MTDRATTTVSTSFHTYAEYDADIRAAFDALARRSGLVYVPGSMPKYANAAVELRFGIDRQTPELYLTPRGYATLTEATLWAAAALPAYQPGTYFTGREHAQARLAFWAQCLAPRLPAIARGDVSRLEGLISAAAAAYEQRLRTYVYDHAPLAHIARTNLWAPDWRTYADAFLTESGGKL